MHIDNHVGVGQTHARTLAVAESVNEIVGDSVLDAIGDVAGVGKFVGVDHTVD